MAKMIGIVVVAALAANAEPPAATMTATCRRTRSAANACNRSYWPSAQRYFDGNVLALDIAGILEASAEGAYALRKHVRRRGVEEPDHRHRRLLRARRKRPRRRSAAEQRDELPPPDHSITSSARARSVGGMSMPSNFAVCRLIANSNLVVCATGRSAGLAPLRMRPV